MPNPLGVNLPDAHLSWGTWADYPDLNGDSFCSFRQAVDHCLDLKCDLFLPGDVIDRSIQDDGVIVAFLAQQMARLKQASLMAWFTVGQHDRTRRVPWLSSLGFPNVCHAHQQSFWPSGRGIACYGLDFQPAGQLTEALTAIPADVQVLLCHQVWRELMGGPTNPEGALADIPTVKLVLTGDFHGHRTLLVRGASEQMMLVVSSGSTHMRSLSEDPNKFFHVVYDDLSVASNRLVTRPCLRFCVRSEEQFQQLLTEELLGIEPDLALPTEIQKPIVHLEYDASLIDIRRRAALALKGRAFLLDRPIKVVTVENSVQEERADALSLEGCLALEAEPGTPVYATALRLLGTPPALLRQEIARVVEEKLATDEEGVL